jgi:uracil-DNA glycosylase family 4
MPSPPPDCPRCPRLAAFRAENRRKCPDFRNEPVPAFGDPGARLLIVGLAPGLRGANRTGRPFTGDFAGTLLYETLIKFGFATGTYQARPDDGLTLHDCRIINAVRCVPPENKPLPAEIATCNEYLAADIAAMPHLRAILALGGIAHQATLRAVGLKQNHSKFAHGATTTLPGPITLIDSFHVSRLNTNTGRLTTPMFERIVEQLRAALT